MKIVQTDEIPLKRGLEHRGGIFHGRIVVEGEPGALDNFQVSYGQMGGDELSLGPLAGPRRAHQYQPHLHRLASVCTSHRRASLPAPRPHYRRNPP